MLNQNEIELYKSLSESTLMDLDWFLTEMYRPLLTKTALDYLRKKGLIRKRKKFLVTGAKDYKLTETGKRIHQFQKASKILLG